MAHFILLHHTSVAPVYQSQSHMDGPTGQPAQAQGQRSPSTQLRQAGRAQDAKLQQEGCEISCAQKLSIQK